MLKLLSLIGSLSLTSSAAMPLSQNVINLNNVAKQGFDISALNGTVRTQRYDYEQENLYLFELTALAHAMTIINKASGIQLDWPDLEIVSSFNMNENRDLTDADVLGRNGAGTTFIKVTLVATESGFEKGVYGEMNYIFKMVHESLQLEIYENLFAGVVVQQIWEADKIVGALRGRIVWPIIGEFTRYPTFGSPESVGNPLYATKLSDGQTFTEEDYEKMEPGSKIGLSTIFYATSEGKRRGVTGAFRVNFVFVKTIICC
ncbi:hypothetical protein [Spiroplasma sp. BIUS-1]|uniref:hypothetical protein n=1 Tax=Spiroplasma sp. BIUS-1 TaxID=216964 RepID=UPI001397BF64|nr:hypothetical protein [Spiroplasma sp. BIUS-1]QHX36743.1 hypothetical protein SBIUS_v1c04900 [Spiroplasma sp. BIUS-1]